MITIKNERIAAGEYVANRWSSTEQNQTVISMAEQLAGFDPAPFYGDVLWEVAERAADALNDVTAGGVWMWFDGGFWLMSDADFDEVFEGV